ncbi:T9SS type A sorting domain-containing protein [Dyadobacter flavalbus]|uniref:T9SS type A sorting domain-containing protein n=1 Tax=Dyadobacter flavalbus TaxID=2579942 RepID=A0A5M8QTZ7_9BACT|nr:T9SS type A sorting domain-containing protein [Dyadobacter flavalbus]KAA6438294.1 T9SS type A sorting domain-containing protein [Dyadobacter flavalbus]
MKKHVQLTSLKSVLLHGMFVMFLLFFASLTTAFAQTELPFRDDFNRSVLGANWKINNSWSIRNGAAFNASDIGSLVTAGKFAAESYVIETSAKGLTGSYWREFRLIFGQANSAESKAYVLTYYPDSGGNLTLGIATDNIYHPRVLDEFSIYPALEDTRWYKFKIARYKSGLIQVYLDKGQGYSKWPVLETIDLTYKQLGHFGWKVSTQTAGKDFFVDWIGACKPGTEKPAVPEKPEEDNLITQVSVPNGRSYTVSKLNAGSRIYTDRDYQVTSLPGYLKGASFVQTAMEDKNQTQASWLTTFMKKQVVVYVAYDPRAGVLPAWLAGWHKTGDIIGTNDPGSQYLEIYSRQADIWQVYPRPFILGANLASPASGTKMNYLVAAVELPASMNLEAENAKLSGAVAASDHPGFSGKGYADFINNRSDYIEWTAQIALPGTYSVGYIFANTRNERSLALTVDGVPAGNSVFLPLASWDNWAFYSGQKVFLKAGTHKIRLTATGTSGPNIDFLSLNFVSDNADLVTANSLARLSAQESAASTAREDNLYAYPNPFQVQTTISYELAQPEEVNLAIFTPEGKQQAVLVNGMQAAGKYKVEFNAEKLPAGLYIYQLRHGQNTYTGKIAKQ